MISIVPLCEKYRYNRGQILKLHHKGDVMWHAALTITDRDASITLHTLA